MILLSLRITKDQKKALLSFYPGGIKQFVEKTISDTADKIMIERGQFDIDEELAEYHDRLALNGENVKKKRHKCTQATKDKIRNAQKGKNTGWHPFPETIEKIRLANIGKHSGPNLKARGQKRSEETKRKMSLARIGMTYKKRAKVELN